jgi:hypothetical protein
MAVPLKMLLSLVFWMLPISSLAVSQPPVLTTLHQFPNGTWLENLAVRPSGEVIVDAHFDTIGSIYQVEPRKPASSNAALIHTFAGKNSVWGITHISDDVFAVAAGLYDYPGHRPVNGTFSIYRVDMSHFQSETSKGASVHLITNMTDAGLINGIALLSEAENLLLAADSTNGVIWRVNMTDGTKVVIQDEPAYKFKGGPSDPPIGVNGIRVFDSYLYFTNTFWPFLGRGKVSPLGYGADTIKVISTQVAGDDFAVAKDGSAYVCGNAEGVVWHVSLNGTVTTVVGGDNSTILQGPTSAVFADEEETTLYITTRQAGDVGGKLLALRL